jgi:uncharacterized protein YukE
MADSMVNQVDEATIRQTLDAFEQAMANTNAARQSVDAVSSSVPWHGDAAARYRDALANWLTGLGEVQKGLTDLQSAMSNHLHISANAEDTAASHSNWHIN